MPARCVYSEPFFFITSTLTPKFLTLMKKFIAIVLFVFSLIFISFESFAQQRVKKVVFQAFWWDYWN
jgi:hypothetical protein